MAQQKRENITGWRWFPHASIGSLALVVVVNAGLIWAALGTDPGEATKDDFGTSNRYDSVLALAAKQAELHWRLDTEARSGHPVLHLAGPDGRTLDQAVITGVAQRPLGADISSKLTFTQAPDGAYVAAEALDGIGQWEMRLVIQHGTDRMAVTRRLIVK